MQKNTDYPEIILILPDGGRPTFTVTSDNPDGVSNASSPLVQFNVNLGASSGAIFVNGNNQPTLIATMVSDGYEFIEIEDNASYEYFSEVNGAVNVDFTYVDSKHVSFTISPGTSGEAVATLRFKVKYQKILPHPIITLKWPQIPDQTFSIENTAPDGVTHAISPPVQFNVDDRGAPSGAVTVDGANKPTLIATMEGVGYQFIEPVGNDSYVYFSGLDGAVTVSPHLHQDTKQMMFTIVPNRTGRAVTMLRFKVKYQRVGPKE